MALKVEDMTIPELNTCVREAYKVADINERYSKQLQQVVDQAIDRLVTLISLGRLFRAKREFPVAYREMKQNKVLRHAIWRRRWITLIDLSWFWAIIALFGSMELYNLTNMVNVSPLWPQGLILLGNMLQSLLSEAYNIAAAVMAVCLITACLRYAFGSGTMKRWKLKCIQAFINEHNAVQQAVVSQFQGPLREIRYKWMEALNNEPLGIMCYNALPEDDRHTQVLNKMISLLRQKVVQSWSELAKVTRQEQHLEQVLNKIQITQQQLIKQNQKLTEIATQISNQQLTEIDYLKSIEYNGRLTVQELERANTQLAIANALHASNVLEQANIEYYMEQRYGRAY